MLLSSNSPSPVMSVQKFDDAHISCEDSSGTGENDDLSMISLIAKLMSLVLSRAAPSKCSSLLGNISLSVLRLQSGCALAVLAPSVLKFSVPTEDSMDGRSYLPRKHLTTLLFLYALHAPVLQCPLHYFLHLRGSILDLIQ